MGVELSNYNAHYYNMDVEEDDVEFVDNFDCRIRDALMSVSQGYSDTYDELIGQLQREYCQNVNRTERIASLMATLQALSGSVSILDGNHTQLLGALFSMSLWDYTPEVMDALVELVVTLASSNGKYLDLCLEMLVDNFTPPRNLQIPDKRRRALAKKEEVMVRVHSALQDIAALVPLAPARLLSIVIAKAPKKFADEFTASIAVENMLRLEIGALREVLGSGVLIKSVTDLLVELDVEVDAAPEDPAKDIFHLELEEESFADAGKDVVQIVEKLDSLMVLTLDHVKLCKDNGLLAEVFEALLQSFPATIMRADKSKYTQFVLFYACSLDPEYCGKKFANFLADIYVARHQTEIDRRCAVAYLASYLARATFLETEFVARMLKRVMDCCSEYSKIIRHGVIDPVMHRPFYAGCQAVMYTLCFHMRTIMDTPGTNPGPFLMFLNDILKSSLDPLKVCLPVIVEEFVRQVKVADLVDELGNPVFDDLSESDRSWAFGGKMKLENFPFDPCLLKKCDSYIRPHYRFWSMVVPTYDEGVEYDTDEDAGNYDIDICTNDLPDGGIAESVGDDDYPDDFDDSLRRMSITPREASHMKMNLERSRGSGQMPSKIRPSMSPQ